MTDDNDGNATTVIGGDVDWAVWWGGLVGGGKWIGLDWIGLDWIGLDGGRMQAVHAFENAQKHVEVVDELPRNHTRWRCVIAERSMRDGGRVATPTHYNNKRWAWDRESERCALLFEQKENIFRSATASRSTGHTLNEFISLIALVFSIVSDARSKINRPS